MKRTLVSLTAILLLAALFVGCGRITVTPFPQETETATAPATAVTTEGRTEEPEPEPEPGVSLAEAFKDDALPDITISPDEVAFCFFSPETGSEYEIVPRSEVLEWWEAQETLPRTRSLENRMPESLAELYPFLDYAFDRSYSRVCVPSVGFISTDVAVGSLYLSRTYPVNNSGFSAFTSASFPRDDGTILRFITVTMNGMEKHGNRSEYTEALAAAKEIVAGIPEGSGDYEKTLYIYKWLTDHVTYYKNGYYESDWDLLYDALILNSTVCAGYVEAMCVMCNLVGVDCIILNGAVRISDAWGSHAWNTARVDGEYYLFDATFDAGADPSEYCFFGVSDETIQSFYERILMGTPTEYCPDCVGDLPQPE